MTTLTRAWRWEAYDPDIGDNRAFPEKDRLFLEIASGLSAAQLKQMSDSITAADQTQEPAKAWAAAFAPFVRLVGEHTIDGRQVRTLEEYIAVVADMAGVYNLRELYSAVMDFNSVRGTQQLFSQRHSGGLLSTRARSAEKVDARMAGR